MINEYPDIPARMEDWYDLQLNMVSPYDYIYIVQKIGPRFCKTFQIMVRYSSVFPDLPSSMGHLD